MNAMSHGSSKLPIKLRFSSVDGFSATQEFASLELARAKCAEYLGPAEIGSTYAISGDGIAKCEVVRGCTLSELFA